MHQATEAQQIATPMGLLHIRAEEERDQAFRFALFGETRPALTTLPPSQRDDILRMQFRAQTSGHRVSWPDARCEILEFQTRPVGRLMYDATGTGFHLVDIAVLTRHRGGGIGSAVLRWLMGEAAAAGKPVRLNVTPDNRAAGLYRRLGFAVVGRTDSSNSMEWRASTLGRSAE